MSWITIVLLAYSAVSAALLTPIYCSSRFKDYGGHADSPLYLSDLSKADYLAMFLLGPAGWGVMIIMITCATANTLRDKK